MKKRIFTFWEPKKNIPAYLQLCMNTWKKFLPDYEIIILDYSNLDEWLGKDYFHESLYKNFSLPMQADAIRCALLKKYGGIWFDTDTILTSSKIRDLININSELVFIGSHIGFIVAQKNGKILNKWDKGLKKNIKIRDIYTNYSRYNPIRLMVKFFGGGKKRLINGTFWAIIF